MTNRPRIENLEDVKLWISAHDGRIDAWWSTQHKWNDKIEAAISGLVSRMTALEKRVMLISGASAAFGSILGAIAGVFLKSLFSGGQ